MILKNLKDTYNQIASNHSHYYPTLWPGLKHHLKVHLSNLKANQKVLDLGCGHGRLLKNLPQDINYTGIDFSSAWLNKARQNFPRQNFIQADLTNPQTWQNLGKFDAILAIALIHHLPKKSQQLFILKQAKKHLNNNGFILLTTWNLCQPKFLTQHLKSLPLKLKHLNLRFLKIPYKNTNQKRFYTTLNPRYIKKLIHQAGLKINQQQKTSQNFIYICQS